MAVTGRVQNVDLDLGLDSRSRLDLDLDAGYNQLWSKCTKIIIKVFGQLYLGEIDIDWRSLRLGLNDKSNWKLGPTLHCLVKATKLLPKNWVFNKI